jgi:hypothetical protein
MFRTRTGVAVVDRVGSFRVELRFFLFRLGFLGRVGGADGFFAFVHVGVEGIGFVLDVFLLSSGILGGEADVFGAEAYADEAGRDAAEVGEALEEFEGPGEG